MFTYEIPLVFLNFLTKIIQILTVLVGSATKYIYLQSPMLNRTFTRRNEYFKRISYAWINDFCNNLSYLNFYRPLTLHQMPTNHRLIAGYELQKKRNELTTITYAILALCMHLYIHYICIYKCVCVCFMVCRRCALCMVQSSKSIGKPFPWNTY